jgi:hypothetical protein
MKCLSLFLLMILCTSMLGCSTVAHIMQQGAYGAHPDNDWVESTDADKHSGSFQVYNNSPYTLHLEIEETDSQGEMEPVNGDGGASLNAYAACLTLKVIF